MDDTGVLDIAQLHVIAKTHQRRFHHRLHKVAGVSGDGPVLLRRDPLLELLPLLLCGLQRCHGLAAMPEFAVNAIGQRSARRQAGAGLLAYRANWCTRPGK